jgi:hypothetical protein
MLMADLQLVDPDDGSLATVTQRGFNAELLAYFACWIVIAAPLWPRRHERRQSLFRSSLTNHTLEIDHFAVPRSPVVRAP